jgi:hypothetical protein
LDLGKVTTGNNGRGLVVDTNFKTSGTPVNKLDCTFGLDGGDCRIDILGNDITTVQETARHVLSVTGVTLDHLVGWLKARVGDLSYSQLFMISFFRRDDRSIGHEGEMNTRVGNKIGLELGKINVEGSIKTKGCRDRRHDLGQQTVEVRVGWAFNVQVAAADIVNRFIVNHERTVRVFQGGVGGQNGVVWFDNRGRDLGSRIDREFELNTEN